MKNRLGGLLLLCVLVGLGVAVIVGVLLSRRLTAPLSYLTRAVERRASLDLLTPDAPGPRASPVPPLPPIPLTELEDEVGVLARALAAREEACNCFVLRESFFTGDVSMSCARRLRFYKAVWKFWNCVLPECRGRRSQAVLGSAAAHRGAHDRHRAHASAAGSPS